jgi:hypothetical protein
MVNFIYYFNRIIYASTLFGHFPHSRWITAKGNIVLVKNELHIKALHQKFKVVLDVRVLARDFNLKNCTRDSCVSLLV